MPRPKKVKITKDGAEGTVLETSLAVWERNGWTRADDGGSEAGPPEAVTPAQAPTTQDTSKEG